jgi:hypothetical protein
VDGPGAKHSNSWINNRTDLSSFDRISDEEKYKQIYRATVANSLAGSALGTETVGSEVKQFADTRPKRKEKRAAESDVNFGVRKAVTAQAMKALGRKGCITATRS